MRRLRATGAILCFGLVAGIACGQSSVRATLSSGTPGTSPEKTGTDNAPSRSPSPETDAAGKPRHPTGATSPIVTEIYADQTVFDSEKSIGIFTGNIVVTDPRFNIQGDKLTIFISKKQNESFEKAIVEGNVGVVRNRPSAGGSSPEQVVGRCEKAIYTAKDGRFELTGNPRVQQGFNTHVATSPDTIMILNEAGQLETRGPSRTEIRQDPSAASSTPKP